MLEHGPLIKRLLTGEFICRINDPDAYRHLQDENTRQSIDKWICPYISRHLLSLNPLLACCRRYSRGER